MSSLSDAPAARTLLSIAKAELPPGASRAVVVGYRKILVLNDGGTYYAIHNSCPHHQAPLSAGRIAGTNGPTEVGTFNYSNERRALRCPWHHYEYDLVTGECLADPKRYRVATYEIHQDETHIHVQAPTPK